MVGGGGGWGGEGVGIGIGDGMVAGIGEMEVQRWMAVMDEQAEVMVMGMVKG